MHGYKVKTRYDIFLHAYIANGFSNVYQAALRAGYAKTTARAQGKRILDTAIRKTLKVAELSPSYAQ
jgi:phage terminase small subunit